MRSSGPGALTPSSDISYIKGAGPARTALLAKLGLLTAGDLLFFFPRRYEDRRKTAAISGLAIGAPAVVFARVISCEARELPGRGRRVITCRFADGTGEIQAVWFNMRGLEKILCKGAEAALFGVPLLRGGALQMTSPEFSVSADAAKSFTGIIPVYPLTEGLAQKWVRRTVKAAADALLPEVSEGLPPDILEKRSLIPLPEALAQMHSPESPEKWKEARKRLAYEELFMLQAMMICTRKERSAAGCAKPRSEKARALLDAAPFRPTAAQEKAVSELLADASSGRPMRRLLQGDVGCGKSLAAAAFAASVCGSGAQCALLAPTEALAGQLFCEIRRYLGPMGFRCALLTSSVKGPERKAILAGLADGTLAAAAGTHSLLSDEVKFQRLGALIIDEQQRFGVRQRSELLLKYPSAHLLMMSATPIPRTAALALYGDLDMTVIGEKPQGRIPPETRLLSYEKLPELMRFLIKEISAGGRVYWICPRVEEDVASEIPAAKKRCAWLKKMLPPVPVSLIYGQQESAEKAGALEAFRTGASKILVGTTVLEVGINVPEASVIVIESPERYGFSQLHQMRGRVGRGARRGVCILLAGATAASAENGRLEFFASTDDGFRIAEADLAFRGAGEIAGTAQHGETLFRAADLSKDTQLCADAKADAARYAEKYGTEALRALIKRSYLAPSPCESRFF